MKRITDTEYNDILDFSNMEHHDDLYTAVEEEQDGSYTVRVASIMKAVEGTECIVSLGTVSDVKEKRTDADLFDAYCRASVPTDYHTSYLFDTEEEMQEYLDKQGAMRFFERLKEDKKD